MIYIKKMIETLNVFCFKTISSKNIKDNPVNSPMTLGDNNNVYNNINIYNSMQRPVVSWFEKQQAATAIRSNFEGFFYNLSSCTSFYSNNNDKDGEVLLDKYKKTFVEKVNEKLLILDDINQKKIIDIVKILDSQNYYELVAPQYKDSIMNQVDGILKKLQNQGVI